MADERGAVILDWNLTNWVTIVLMAAIGILLLMVTEKAVLYFKNKQQGGTANG